MLSAGQRSLFFVLLVGILGVQVGVWGQNVRPNHVAINEPRKHIDVDSSWLDKTGQQVQQVGLDASDKEKVFLDLLTERKQLLASAHGNVAVAEIAQGARAQVQRFGDKGGLAQVEGHNAQLKTKVDEEGKHALLKADGQYELDTIAHGSLKEASDTDFEARNDRFNFKLDPASHSKNEGQGVLGFEDKEKNKSGKYQYAITQNGKKTEAQLSANDVSKNDYVSSLFGRRSEKYYCTAETPGISQCYDAQGKSAGKVVADKNGNTVVYNDKDVPIGTGSVRKVSDRSYEQNLFIARLKDARHGPCCHLLTGSNCTEPMKVLEFGIIAHETNKSNLVSQPQFSHPSQRNEDGVVQLTWPDCFDMSIDVTLPPNVHISRLAMKLDINVQPIGKLRCMDVATCGRECYYCDFCKNSRKLKLLENTDGNLCRATEERTYRLTTKVWMKFYERGPNRPELEKEFFSQLDNPLLGKAFKLAIIGEWLAANSLDVARLLHPSNSELLEYWVSKRHPDRLLACEHAVVDYEIEGAKVKTNLLFEAATTATNIPNIFRDKKCAQFEKLQEQRFQTEVQEFKSRGGGGGIFGGIGNLFRNGGR
uniref:Uncharacterized protein n=1 Tax=Ditylenchus dipsaci TaxID=166011 RepID=A0A915DEC2_9BILA